eukprot:gene11053-18658_t
MRLATTAPPEPSSGCRGPHTPSCFLASCARPFASRSITVSQRSLRNPTCAAAFARPPRRRGPVRCSPEPLEPALENTIEVMTDIFEKLSPDQKKIFLKNLDSHYEDSMKARQQPSPTSTSAAPAEALDVGGSPRTTGSTDPEDIARREAFTGQVYVQVVSRKLGPAYARLMPRRLRSLSPAEQRLVPPVIDLLREIEQVMASQSPELLLRDPDFRYAMVRVVRVANEKGLPVPDSWSSLREAVPGEEEGGAKGAALGRDGQDDSYNQIPDPRSKEAGEGSGSSGPGPITVLQEVLEATEPSEDDLADFARFWGGGSAAGSGASVGASRSDEAVEGLGSSGPDPEVVLQEAMEALEPSEADLADYERFWGGGSGADDGSGADVGESSSEGDASTSETAGQPSPELIRATIQAAVEATGLPRDQVAELLKG